MLAFEQPVCYLGATLNVGLNTNKGFIVKLQMTRAEQPRRESDVAVAFTSAGIFSVISLFATKLVTVAFSLNITNWHASCHTV